MNFDSTGLFGISGRDTATASHEVGEWMDGWTIHLATIRRRLGDIPDRSGCQGNLEVGDPLSGTEGPRIVMPNGFTYHLQELAFFSWFYNSRSVGVNGWFSDNGTSLTDAGPPCKYGAWRISGAAFGLLFLFLFAGVIKNIKISAVCWAK
jgi:hypothetical protein